MQKDRAEHLARRERAIVVRCPVDWCSAPVGTGCYRNEWTSTPGPIHDERLAQARVQGHADTVADPSTALRVHDHGPEDGPGLACNETRLPDGTLRGACLTPGVEDS